MKGVRHTTKGLDMNVHTASSQAPLPDFAAAPQVGVPTVASFSNHAGAFDSSLLGVMAK
jgi:hypothetical protein